MHTYSYTWRHTEELPADWSSEAIKALKPFARFVMQASADTMSPQPEYSFTCCVFHSTVVDAAASGLPLVNEGSVEILTAEQLQSEKFCWGYNEVFRTYLDEILKNTSWRGDTSLIKVRRVKSDIDLGEWADKENWA